MVTKIKNNSSNYLPPAHGSYPQLKQTGSKIKTQARLDKTSDDVDSYGNRKHYRFTVDSKPVCITLLGIPDGFNFLVDQIFDAPSCEQRKPVDQVINADCCQVTFLKPGRYEIREEDFGLFPEDVDVKERKISSETAALLIAQKGGTLCLT